MRPNILAKRVRRQEGEAGSQIVGIIEHLDAEGRILHRWQAKQRQVSIGEHPDCSVRINAPEIAPVHAVLNFGRRNVFIRSLEGVIRVDDRLVREWLFDHSAMVRIGETALRVIPCSEIHHGGLPGSAIRDAKFEVEPLHEQTHAEVLTDAEAPSAGELRQMVEEVLIPIQQTLHEVREQLSIRAQAPQVPTETKQHDPMRWVDLIDSRIRDLLDQKDEHLSSVLRSLQEAILSERQKSIADGGPSRVGEQLGEIRDRLALMQQNFDTLRSELRANAVQPLNVEDPRTSEFEHRLQGIEERSTRLEEFLVEFRYELLERLSTRPERAPEMYRETVSDARIDRFADELEARHEISPAMESAPERWDADAEQPIRESRFGFTDHSGPRNFRDAWSTATDESYEQEPQVNMEGAIPNYLHEQAKEPSAWNPHDSYSRGDEEQVVESDSNFVPYDPPSSFRQSALAKDLMEVSQENSADMDELGAEQGRFDALDSSWRSTSDAFEDDLHHAEEASVSDREDGDISDSHRNDRQSAASLGEPDANSDLTAEEHALGRHREAPDASEFKAHLPQRDAEGKCEEDSIEDYMAQLLRRLRGENSASSSSETEHSNASLTSQAPAPVGLRESLGATTTSRTTLREGVPTSEPAVRRPMTREMPNEIAAMREIANKNTRSAIHVSKAKRMTSTIQSKIALACIGYSAAIFLTIQNGISFSYATVGILSSLAVGVIWTGEAVVTWRTLRRETKANELDTAASPSPERNH